MNHIIKIPTLCFLFALLIGTVGLNQTANAEKKVTAIKVFPADVNLKTSRDKQSVIVQAVYANGLTQDVTAQAKFVLENKSLVKQVVQTFYPLANGKTKMAVSYAGHSVSVPVNVVDATKDVPVSFQLDVMPVFMRSGCNTGSCHGSARGKDGFRMSLFGFDPEADYYRITREMSGRRINVSLPEESLMLTKATGKVNHSGGKLMREKSELYKALYRWIDAGAPKDKGKVPHVVSLELYPKSGVFDGPGTTTQLSVRAVYSDGTDRDVTSLAAFSTSNDNSAKVTKSGLVTASHRGEAFLTARFETHTVGSQFIVLPQSLKFTWSNVPENNYIDKLVHNKLKKLRITPSALCSDEVFLRRVYFDVVGVPPTVEEYHRFMSSQDAKKREKLVDELLNRKEFVEVWVMKWAERLAIRSVRNRIDYKPMLGYYNWLQSRIAANVPMDKIVQELLAAKGGTLASPATNFFQAERSTLKTSENVAQVFMGMRIQCAQCHNHPFDRWTMDDYYSFGAFFSQIGRKRAEDPREQIVYNKGKGEVRHPVKKRNMPPKFLGGAIPDVKGKDRRVVLAGWLASDENPYFSKNIANFIWEHFMGKGIVNPVDDVRVTNPPVNKELMDELGKRLRDYRYDFKKLVRDICLSRTYQLATQTNETNKSDATNFSHAQLRRIRAEFMLDAISKVTNTRDKFRGLPLGARAVQVADGNTTNYFLSTFGRAKRETVCTCEVRIEPNLSQALNMLNGKTSNGKVTQGKLVAQRLKEKKTPQQIIEEIYIRCLSRKPTKKELKALNKVLEEEKKETQKVLEDIFWAVLNSREFMFNH